SRAPASTGAIKLSCLMSTRLHIKSAETLHSPDGALRAQRSSHDRTHYQERSPRRRFRRDRPPDLGSTVEADPHPREPHHRLRGRPHRRSRLGHLDAHPPAPLPELIAPRTSHLAPRTSHLAPRTSVIDSPST